MVTPSAYSIVANLLVKGGVLPWPIFYHFSFLLVEFVIHLYYLQPKQLIVNEHIPTPCPSITDDGEDWTVP